MTLNDSWSDVKLEINKNCWRHDEFAVEIANDTDALLSQDRNVNYLRRHLSKIKIISPAITFVVYA